MYTFSGSIFKCNDGHTICESCKGKLPQRGRSKECPSCKGKLGNIRNRALEAMVENTDLPCGYDGCDFTAKGAVLSDHKSNCEHRPYACPHADGKSCSWEGAIGDVVEHMKTAHKVKEHVRLDPRNGKGSSLFTDPNTNTNPYWVSMVKFDGEIFIETMSRCPDRTYQGQPTYHYFLRHVSPHSNVFDYTAKIAYRGRERTFMAPTRSVRDTPEDMVYSEDCLMIPEHTALYMSGGPENKDLKLEVKVTITRS